VQARSGQGRYCTLACQHAMRAVRDRERKYLRRKGLRKQGLRKFSARDTILSPGHAPTIPARPHLSSGHRQKITSLRL
jgi:hypothetical protein